MTEKKINEGEEYHGNWLERFEMCFNSLNSSSPREKNQEEWAAEFVNERMARLLYDDLRYGGDLWKRLYALETEKASMMWWIEEDFNGKEGLADSFPIIVEKFSEAEKSKNTQTLSEAFCEVTKLLKEEMYYLGFLFFIQEYEIELLKQELKKLGSVGESIDDSDKGE